MAEAPVSPVRQPSQDVGNPVPWSNDKDDYVLGKVIGKITSSA